eukprot:1014903-Pelagomonas_calceolata.AAC.8
MHAVGATQGMLFRANTCLGPVTDAQGSPVIPSRHLQVGTYSHTQKPLAVGLQQQQEVAPPQSGPAAAAGGRCLLLKGTSCTQMARLYKDAPAKSTRCKRRNTAD